MFKLSKLLSYDTKLTDKFAHKKLVKYSDGEKYDFNGIYLPFLPVNQGFLYEAHCCVVDILDVFLHNEDDYSWKYVDKSDKYLVEGVYCYKKDEENVDITIHKGDIVIDLGAWIGDFSAYACKKGATVYAFEPSGRNRVLLEKTIQYNSKNEGVINIVPFGAGNENIKANFFEFNEYTAGSNFLVNSKNSVYVDIVKLDDWIKINKINTINFIKADIEGFEREMLKGAVNILKTHQPVLSLCTYHLPDDPEVMKKIILTANENYRIIQRREKMFAYVPII
jgi:FkbM family methyltransferase